MGKMSVWKEQTGETSFPSLNSDITVDVVIIGGGITGITAAYNLFKAGKKVAVIEARKIGGGATGYSTGNLYCTIGSPGLQTVLKHFDEERLTEVVASRAAAVDFIEQRVKEYNIDCDFKRVSWSLFTEDGQQQSFIEKEKETAQKAGLTVTETVPFPRPVKYGFTIDNQAQFNPFKYVVEFAKNLQSENCKIYEQTIGTEFKEGDSCTVTTATGAKITAAHIVMATHTPKGIYFVHTSLGPYREYAVAVKLNGDYPPAGVFWDMRQGEHYSMRTYDTYEGKVLMVLGEIHKVGQKENNKECFDNLERFLRERFDVASVEFQWSAQQFKPADGIPFIGLSTGNAKTYIATGFSADGLTYGTLAGMIITDEIVGKPNKWSKTYDASRLTPLASAKEFVKENINVAAELIKDWIAKEDAKHFSEVVAGNGKIMEVNGKKCAVHRDYAGNLNVVSAICPHMGCIVHWNEAETSWDCPCHGSRFAIDGEVLEGPAIHALKKVQIRVNEKK
jgi:glycine/D-amino acid oxidase-like deaminating enzyme/nitrite reductase/ring-hydroxylating ferredoxin subunit